MRRSLLICHIDSGELVKGIKIVSVFLCISLCQLQDSFCQNNTLYLMPSVPQANQLNPAYSHPCKIYISLPVISSVRLNVRNTGFGFNDVIHTGTGSQSGTYYPDIDNLEKKLMGMNYTLLNTDVDIFGFGINIKDWFFTFGITNHISGRLSYPDDVITLKDGNWDVANGLPKPVVLSKLGANSTVWNSIGISASKELSEGFRAGVRIKYLNGMANLNTRKSRIELNTYDDPIMLEAALDYKVNLSLPVSLRYGTNGLVNTISFDPVFRNIVPDYIFNGNRGISLDGGVIYDLDEKTQVSASFTDLGYISWKKNVNNLTGTGNFTFSGIDIDQYISDPNQDDLLEALGDSLLNAFQASSSSQSYITTLPLSIFGGVTHELTPNIKAGAVTRIEIYNYRVRPSLTLSLNFTPLKAFAASVSYTLMNNKYDQFGAGLAFGRKGAQFFIATDNIPVRFVQSSDSPAFWPYNARMVSMRFGLNLFLKCDQNEKGKTGQRRPGSKSIDDCPAYW